MKKEFDFFDRPRNNKIILIIFLGVLALLLAADLLIHKHPYFYIDGLPFFYALYGFAAYVLLVLVAQFLRRFLERGEDYYD